MSVTTIPQGLENVLGSVQETQKKEDPLGRDAFLKMLIAQVKHQDPLNPMEGSDFSAQLAQFSSLEQLFNMNDSLETIASSLGSGNEENILDYIGKEVLSKSDQLKLKEGLLTGGVFTLESPSQMMVSIYDEVGREVVTLYPGQLPAGTHQIDWNGYDSTGGLAADGTYRFELTAIDENGIYSPVKAAASGVVTGVSYEDGTAYLEIDGKRVDPATVVKVKQPSSGV
jgi:flagellar basal-body rod modification protein FlgD